MKIFACLVSCTIVPQINAVLQKLSGTAQAQVKIIPNLQPKEI